MLVVNVFMWTQRDPKLHNISKLLLMFVPAASLFTKRKLIGYGNPRPQ